MRIVLTLADGAQYLIPWSAFRGAVDPNNDDVSDFVHAYAVEGRSVDTKYVEFAGGSPPMALFDGNPPTAHIDAMLDDASQWTTLVSFPLHVEAMQHPGNYITYSNDEIHWPAGSLDKAATAQGKIRAAIEASQRPQVRSSGR